MLSLSFAAHMHVYFNIYKALIGHNSAQTHLQTGKQKIEENSCEAYVWNNINEYENYYHYIVWCVVDFGVL